MTIKRRNPRVALVVLAALLGALLVSACGGSGASGGAGKPASSKSAAATTTTSAAASATASASRAAFTTCLKQHGVKVTARRSGAGPGFAGGGAGSGRGFPGGGAGFGAGDSKFAKAFQACRSKLGGSGSGFGRLGGRPGGAGNFRPHFTTATLKSYVACIRKNGYAAMPEPKAAGDGSFFPSSVERNARFVAANRKCQSILFKGLRRPPGAGGAGPGGPGSGGGTITAGGNPTASKA